ncbi:hypothetical protein [Nocardia sp. BMG51109]|uniref:hypothetical protein n=1 Tax=Nocardia sp. BMG51109 TaxID=1056816 RepID=UPI000467205D|nr:hypothetical protein [Nocardia sp. BMG51109]
MTPEQDAILRDIQTQLRGPGGAGWPQLGTDAQGDHRSLVEGLAEALTLISELRTEIGDLEATVADLEQRVQRLSGHQWPWPLSLLEGPATMVSDQLARLESVLSELPLANRNGDTPPTGRNGT